MEFKFKKGQKVHVRFGEIFSSSFGGTGLYTAGPGLPGPKNQSGEPEYKVKFFTGWWKEKNLLEV